MFPDCLDNANVLFHTDRGNYGTIARTSGGAGWQVAYLAVCAYPDSQGVYLFFCDERYDVMTDSLYTSLEECLSSRQGLCWHRKEGRPWG